MDRYHAEHVQPDLVGQHDLLEALEPGSENRSGSVRAANRVDARLADPGVAVPSSNSIAGQRRRCSAVSARRVSVPAGLARAGLLERRRRAVDRAGVHRRDLPEPAGPVVARTPG